MIMAPFIQIAWLRDLSPALQERYFEARNRCYVDHWEHRLGDQKQVGLRDEFDDEHVVVALGPQNEILGGVRAIVSRPLDPAASRRLPLEKYAEFDFPALFPEHGLDRASYAEAGRLFLTHRDSPGARRALTFKMLDFLMSNIPDVDHLYFCVRDVLRPHYELLARHKGLAYSNRAVAPLARSYVGCDARETGWCLFALQLRPDSAGGPA